MSHEQIFVPFFHFGSWKVGAPKLLSYVPTLLEKQNTYYLILKTQHLH